MESGKEIIGGSAGGRPKANIWKHVTILDDKRVKCNYCQLLFSKSANRIKSHLYKIEGKGIRVCTLFPQLNNESNISGSLRQNLINSQGSPILDTVKDHNKLNEKIIYHYMSPKIAWKGMTQQEEQMNTKTKQQGMKQVGPFSVSNTVDAHNLQLIEYMFDPLLEQSEIIFSSPDSHLNRNEFTTLKPRSLLDSMVIDVFVEYLTDIERKKKSSNLNCYLPITFSTLASRVDESSLLDFLERQKMKEKYFPKLSDCEKIFIPIHIDKGFGHFCLYVIYLKNKEIEIWDSFPSFTNEEEHREKAQKLMLALDISFVDDKWYSNWKFSKFQMRVAKDTPLQPNEYDCGIFVINFMQQLTNTKGNYSAQFCSDEERLDLALKLLNSDLNKQREKLHFKVAQQHSTTNRHSFGLKRKDMDICRGFPKDIQTHEYTILEYSNKRGKNNVGLIGVQENLVHSDSRVALTRELHDLEGLRVLCDDNNMAALAPALPSTTPFSHLRHLKIEGCKGIKKLMTPELSAQFQNLEIVLIGDCESMKQIFAIRSGEEEDEEAFDSISKHSEYIISLPKLNYLWLHNLPELYSLYKGIMICPSLRFFNITYCSKLKSLPEFQPALQIDKTPTGWNII